MLLIMALLLLCFVKAINSYEISVYFYQIVWCHVLEYCLGNFTSHFCH